MGFDIDSVPGYGPSDAPATVDKGPATRRAAAGKAPEPVAKTDAELGIDEGPRAANMGNSPGRPFGAAAPTDTPIVNGVPLQPGVTDNPIVQDPLAQGVVAGTLGAGAAALAAPAAAAAGAGPLVSSMVGGAAGGATAAGVTGQNPAVGAIAGGALPLGGALASKGMSALAPWGQAAARRIATREVTELGQAAAGAGKGKTQAALMRLDPEKTAQTLQDNGISLRGQSAAEAQAAQRAALARTGAELGSARDAIDAADPARKTVGDAMKAVEDKIQALRTGPKANVPLADAIHSWSKDYLQAQGGNAKAALSVSDLSKTISALEEKGYGGMSARLPGGDAKVAARQIASALNGVLDDHIKTVAATNPAAAAAAKEIAAKSAEFRVLKTVQPIVDQRAVAERFAPTTAQKVMADPVAAAKKIGAAVVTSPIRGAAALPRAADAIMARLFTARAAGAVTPQLLQEAERAGIAAPLLQHFAQPARQAP